MFQSSGGQNDFTVSREGSDWYPNSEQKRGLIEREENSALSVRQQCELLGLNRSTLYYEAVPWNEGDLQLMNLIDEWFTEMPDLGVRQMMWRIRDSGVWVGRKRVRTLMRYMGLFPIMPTRNTSKPPPRQGGTP